MFGNIGDQRLNLLDKKDLIKHGRYDRNEIEKLLTENNINLVCIFSIWPETYSYTLSESIAAGIPTLVTDIGALGERVKRYDIGWTIKYDDDYKNILSKIYEIIENKEMYLNKKVSVENVVLPTKNQVANYYEKLYLKNSQSKLKYLDSIIVKNMLLNYKLNNIDMISYDNRDNSIIVSELNRKVEQLENELNLMKSTLGWKVMEYVRNNVPNFIKNMGKKIIYFCAKLKNN